MIVNRHVRRDFAGFVIPHVRPTERVMTVCGKKTTALVTGIPTVTEQDVFTTMAGDHGWCLECCDKALKELTDIISTHTTSPTMREVIVEAMKEMARQLEISTSVHGRTI